MNSLRPYDQALSDLRARLSPAAVHMRAIAQAVGYVAAEDVAAPAPLPTQAVALRDGYEMSSQQMAGASSYAPVLLASAPRFVRVGEVVSPDCDCVVDASGLDLEGPLPQALVESFPGENMRRAGEDFAQGAVILRAGEMVSSQHVLLLAAAGIANVKLRVPVIAVRGAASPLLDFLRDQVTRMGAELAGQPDLILSLETKLGAPRLALEPGADLSLSDEQGVPIIHVPPRIDHVLAALHGFVWPVLDLELGELRLPLAQKIASRVGLAEFALLDAREGQFHVKALGDWPLQSLNAATHVCLVAAMREGHAAGEMISAIPVRA